MNKNIPEIRFKGFSDEWEQRKLNELTDYADYRGKSPKKTKEGIQLITASNIRYGYIDYNADKQFVAEEDYPDVMRRGIPKLGEILFTTEAPLGNVAQVNNENIALAQRVIKFAGKENLINNEYLFEYFLAPSFQVEINKKASGGTVKGIKGKVLHNIFINFPKTIEEQMKIGKLLKHLDKTIALHQQKLELLKQNKKGFLQKMFPKKGESVPGIRFSNIDKRWNRIRLKELVQYRSSKYSSNQFNGDAKQGAFPVFDANNTIAWIEEYDEEQDYLSIIKDGAGVGRMVKRPGKSSIIGTMGYLITEEQNIDFIHAVLQKVNFTKFIVGSTIPHIYFKDYGNLKIRIPSLEEQQKIGEFFKQLDNKMKLHEEKLNSLNQIKKSFLQKMFV